MSQDKKSDAIIRAALKRFVHFGVAKTTMNEIAGDLAISKASLYYYFPDKISLFSAVLQSISESNREKVETVLAAEPDPSAGIIYYLEQRTEFILNFYNVLEFLKSGAAVTGELKPLFDTVRRKELALITSLFEKGRQAKRFMIEDSRKTAELFFDTLEGFRYSQLLHNQGFFPDKKQFQSILKREKEFSVIFLKGIGK